MSGGNGTKYVTLVDDKNAHLMAEGERTACGIPVPIAGGAEWTYAEPTKVCAACTKTDDKLQDERAPFEAEMTLAAPDDEPPKAKKK